LHALSVSILAAIAGTDIASGRRVPMKNANTRRVCAITVALGLLAVSPASVRAQTPTALPLVQAGNMRYLGSFPVAATDGSGTEQGSLTYGGAALSVNPATQTLYIGGHDWYGRLCEVRIPAAFGQTAPVSQRCTDVTEGRLGQIDGDAGVKLGGTLVWNGRLIVSAYSYYDADYDARLSHFSSSLNLSQPGDVQGPVQVGQIGGGFVGGYMGAIPQEWRAIFGGPAFTGQCCLSIIGRTSSGPSVSVFNPDDVGRVSPVAASPVLAYPLSNPLAPNGGQNNLYNNATEIVGVAFPAGTRSVLFIGKQGLGRYCYGEGPACGDPSLPYKGSHAYPYTHQVWAYDATELAMVKHGQKPAWAVRPYAVWRLSDMDNSGGASIAGATYDPSSGRVYVTEEYGAQPRVHVYQLGSGSVGAPATPPQNFRVSVSGSSVTFTWNPNAAGEVVTDYLLDAGTASNSSNLVSGAPLGAGFVLTVPNVPTGTYYVRIRARNAAGVSSPSSEVRFTVGAATGVALPGAPTLTASATGGVVRLSWSPSSSGGVPSSYVLEAGSAPGLNQLSGDVGATRSLTVPGVPPGTYHFRARGRNAAGIGPPSADVRVVVR